MHSLKSHSFTVSRLLATTWENKHNDNDNCQSATVTEVSYNWVPQWLVDSLGRIIIVKIINDKVVSQWKWNGFLSDQWDVLMHSN